MIIRILQRYFACDSANPLKHEIIPRCERQLYVTKPLHSNSIYCRWEDVHRYSIILKIHLTCAPVAVGVHRENS